MLVTWFEGFSPYVIANIFFSMIWNLLQKVIFLMPILIRDLNRQPPKLVQYGWKASIISQSKKKITKNIYKCGFQTFLARYQGYHISEGPRQNFMIYTSFERILYACSNAINGVLGNKVYTFLPAVSGFTATKFIGRYRVSHLVFDLV